MTNRYLVNGSARASAVDALFGRIAHRYDLINDLQSFGLHRFWKRKLIKIATPKPGDLALDVCCGTGDLVFSFRRAGAVAYGLDFNAAMLAVAAQRADKQEATAPACPASSALLSAGAGSVDRVTFLRGDALAIPFPRSCFSVVTISYGLRNLSDWEAGFEEMLRVCQPGGRLLVLDFGKPQNRFWRQLYFFYLRAALPWFGRLFCRDADAYAYIFKSLQPYPAQWGVARKMEACGCTGISVYNLLGGMMSINFGRKRSS